MVEDHRDAVTDTNAEAAETPARRRAPRDRAAGAQAPPDAPGQSAPPPNGAAPAPRRRRRAVAKPVEDAPASGDGTQPSAEMAPPDDAEKPKPARRRRPTKTSKAPEGAQETETAATAAPEAPLDPAPEAPESEKAETPKPAPRRRRRTTAKAVPPETLEQQDATATEPAAAPGPALGPVIEAGQPPTGEVHTVGPEEAAQETTPSPRRRRRRGRRGGGGLHHQSAEQAVAGIPPLPEPEIPLVPEEPEEDEDEVEVEEERPAGGPVPRRDRVRGRPRGGRQRPKTAEELASGPDHSANLSFMHPSEREFAYLLEYYGIRYLYEPRSFPLKWEGERVVQMFTPDFYLPEYDQYFELTTMKQSLVTQKNRKLRQVRELYPDVNIQLLYRRDLMRLMGKYGFGPLAEAPVEGTEQVLFSEQQVCDRVKELGRQITEDYAGSEPVLIGILRGVVVFMADLMRQIDLPMQIEFMEISHYGEEREDSIEVIRDAGTEVLGRDVILVEDIVDTGLTLRYLLEHLWAKKPASVKVCTLLDKSVRRMADVPLDYVGFEVPDEFVIGYGLDYGGRYRNLRYIGVLKPVEPKPVPQR